MIKPGSSPHKSCVPELRAIEPAYTSKPLYHYHELPKTHIRLLEIFPGPKESQLRCSVYSAELQDTLAYEAISYVWGDPKSTDELDCNEGWLSITISLSDALRRLRLVDRPRVLWADAVCINQQDAEEKAEQVKLMGLIYWRAQRVNVWLGRDEEEHAFLGGAAAMSYIRAVCQEMNPEDMPMHKLPPVASKSIADGNFEHYKWTAIQKWFNLPWFKRVWVVQEVGLAQESVFYCGDATLTGGELEDFTKFLNIRGATLKKHYWIDLGQYQLIQHYFVTTRGSLRIEYGSAPRYAENFLHILNRAEGLQCTDPRDAVYAFLGHPSAYKQHLLDGEPYMWFSRNFDRRIPFIQPDYNESNTVADLYVEVAIKIHDKLDIGPELLSFVKHNETSLAETYPSWVPRWNLPYERSGLWRSPNYPYLASGELRHSVFKFVVNSGSGTLQHLQLKALGLDEVRSSVSFSKASHFELLPALFVAATSQEVPQDIDAVLENPIEALYIFYTSIRPSLPNPFRNDPISLAQTLTADAPRNISGVKAEDYPYRLFEDFCTYRLRKASAWGPELPSDEIAHLEQYDGDADQFCLDVTATVENRTFFFTADGYLGIGPRLTEHGDQIWIPLGAKVPVVLRPLENGTFKVLGEAYVHGVMEGEVVEGLNEGDFDEITLC